MVAPRNPKPAPPRTFYRELERVGQMGFITFRREENKEWIIELDFDAIGKY